IASLAIVAVDFAGLQEHSLGDALAYRQQDGFAGVQVIDLKCQPVDIAGIDPASVKTDSNAVASPAAAAFDLVRARRFDAEELMGVREDALAGFESDDGVVFRDILRQCHAV